MYFEQFRKSNTGCLSYLVGCLSVERCAVIDPQITIKEYIDVAKKHAMKISYVIDTHTHADHFSGARALAKAAGAKLLLWKDSPAKFPFQPIEDGEELEVGNVSLKALHTPGHTTDSVSFVVDDRTRSKHGWFVLTGDTLFIGDVGRPDLAGRGDPAQLYNSIFNRLLKLDEYLEVYPAHFSGSACGRFMSPKPVSTIGFEKRFNKALTVKSKNEFMKAVMEGLPDPPAKFIQIIKKNKGE